MIPVRYQTDKKKYQIFLSRQHYIGQVFLLQKTCKSTTGKHIYNVLSALYNRIIGLCESKGIRVEPLRMQKTKNAEVIKYKSVV